ncbi:hypothetical protein SPICUR_00910 [Spiribacter curvatus]|uniref:Uncharacterized protein n=1 Tax=Spiribacter curvatus TaxID=1335757 RepID=U5T4Y4_9GAMM|nr:hypothetical protein SPICUR_00910 [Spiribacter curvatus]
MLFSQPLKPCLGWRLGAADTAGELRPSAVHRQHAKDGAVQTIEHSRFIRFIRHFLTP